MHRIGLHAALATTAVALALTACGPSGDGAGVPGRSTAVDPCAGVAGCAEVAVADVDGDGSPDRVGVARQKVESSPEITTLVATRNTVHTLTLKARGIAYPTPAEIYRGAFAISRAEGADLALHLVPGRGNAEQFAVVTWDGAKLVTLAPPPYVNGNEAVKTTDFWYLGSSHGTQHTVKCLQPAEIALVQLSAAVAEGVPVEGGGKREEDRFTFVGSGWQASGSTNVADTSYSYSFDAHTAVFAGCKDVGRKP
ncbi:hypothetical protein [Tsukamurella sp. NPDC003166]|uniref:hypothetical protein n=1 Tax=Tsukamurella sp. NPDC003166 TaxID=3154444 RepID=UPI0033A81B0A